MGSAKILDPKTGPKGAKLNLLTFFSQTQGSAILVLLAEQSWGSLEGDESEKVPRAASPVLQGFCRGSFPHTILSHFEGPGAV